MAIGPRRRAAGRNRPRGRPGPLVVGVEAHERDGISTSIAAGYELSRSGAAAARLSNSAIVVRCASTSASCRGRRRCASEMISTPHGPAKPICCSVVDEARDVERSRAAQHPVVDGVVEQVGGLRCGGVVELDDEHLVAGDLGQIRQRGGPALQVPDVHHQAGCGVVGGGDELGGQPEVGDVGERQRLQRHPGPDVGGLRRPAGAARPPSGRRRPGAGRRRRRPRRRVRS